MFALREAVLLCTIFFSLSSARASKESQRCEAEGRTGVCVEWYNCTSIAEVLRRDPPQMTQFKYVRKFICGYKNRTTYFCCIDEMPAPPPPNQDSLMNHKNRKLIPLETCGKTENKYIVGGEQATLGEFPWLALIHYKHKTRPEHFLCGGALISKRYVLTAAACLSGDKLYGYYPDIVRLGEHNLKMDPDIEDGQEVRFRDIMIEKYIIHEDYSALSENQFHDIGLIRLKDEAAETRYVKPICLPTPEVEKEIMSIDDYLQVAGWGNTETGARSSVLMKVGIPTEDFEKCRKKYNYLSRNVTLNQLCAGMRGKDTCNGDSGGPLMGLGRYSDYKYMRFFAVGLVSYGHAKCGLYDIPGVYTRVLPYVGWILDHMEL